MQFAGAAHDALARDVYEQSADLRRASGNGSDGIDVIGTCRARIDPAGHAILQRQRRTVFSAAGMRMNIDQAGRDDLAPRIDHVRRVACNARLNAYDSPAGDGNVADSVEPDRGIDHAPAFDDQVDRLRKYIWNAGEHCSARRCRRDKLTPVHHDSSRHSANADIFLSRLTPANVSIVMRAPT